MQKWIDEEIDYTSMSQKQLDKLAHDAATLFVEHVTQGDESTINLPRVSQCLSILWGGAFRLDWRRMKMYPRKKRVQIFHCF